MAWLGSNVGGVGGGPRIGRFTGLSIQITRIHTTKKNPTNRYLETSRTHYCVLGGRGGNVLSVLSVVM